MSRYKVGAISTAFAVALVIGLSGGLASAETLKEALAKAYLNNPTLLAARASLRAVDEGVSQAISGWLELPAVAWWDHLGGLLAGVFVGLLYRASEPATQPGVSVPS